MFIKAYGDIVYVVLFVLIFSFQNSYGQPAKPCDSPECRQFDFWLGQWDLEWDDATGNRVTGTNIIKSVLDGCVILENFDGAPGNALIGMSVSTFDGKTGKWKQTWVDNQGSYLDFTGGMTDGEMVLSRSIKQKEKVTIQRMIFYNIEKNNFDWKWEVSDNGGDDFRLVWLIHYIRKK
ncbi:MAG: DUF1579 family protein [Calditrichaceae bacterium]